MEERKLYSFDEIKKLIEDGNSVNTLVIERKYIPLEEKKQIVKILVDSLVTFENGMYVYNEIDRFIYTTTNILAAYTNIDMKERPYEMFDLLQSNDFIRQIFNEFHDDYAMITDMIDMAFSDIDKHNTIEAVINTQMRNINGTVTTTLDALLNTITEKLDSFDMDKGKNLIELASKYGLIKEKK